MQELRYLSPSSAKLGDPRSDGCPRKFYFEKVLDKKSPETAAQRTGTELHAENESYLRTGKKDLSALALAGLHMLPPPDLTAIARGENDLLIESEMGSQFSCADIDCISAVDVARDARLEARWDAADDALRSVGIVSSSGVPFLGRIDLIHARALNYGADSPENMHDPDGTIEVHDHKTSSDIERYGKTPAELSKDVQMLAYGYHALLEFPEVTHVRLSHGYYQTRGARKTRKVSVLLTPDRLREEWGRVTPIARSLVLATRAPTVDDVPANTAACGAFGGCPHRAYCTAAGTNRSLSSLFPSKSATTPRGPSMGIIDKLRQKNQEKQLAAAPKASDKLLAAWQSIKKNGGDQGYPCLAGEVAKLIAAAEGIELKGEALAGTGAIGEATLSTEDEVYAVADELAAELAAGATPEPEPTPVKITPLSPDAPASDPALASAGAEGKDPNKKRGRPPKEKPAASAPVVPVAKTDPTSSDAPAPAILHAEGFVLFVDAVPSIPFVRLNGALLELADAIAAESTKIIGTEVHDIRSCDAKPLGFGGWKGVWAAHVRSMDLPAGTYVLDARGDELMQIAAGELARRAALAAWGYR